MFSIQSCRDHLLAFALVGLACCYPFFQQRIPNGEMVPHPCNPNHVWEGVGHKARGGGGERNSFGLDFYANGKVWTVELCRKDSDGDGKTNGQELGDPDCTWTPGTDPKFRAGLSHPGVCEPMDSPICRSQASFVQCENLEFECDAAAEPGVSNFTVRLPETPVPAQETTYMCMGFEFPQDGKYHMIANVPFIDNINVMHHIVIYGCNSKANRNERPMNKPYNCFMSGREGCNDIIGIWGVGILGECFHQNTGFLVGSDPAGYKWAVMEMHWNNPEERSSWTDSSGMTFFLTKNLRPYNAGMLLIGQTFLEIPPGEERYTASSRLSSSCTEQQMTGPVSIVGTLNHMHYLGSRAVSSVVDPEKHTTYLAYDQKYSYDRPVFHTYDSPMIMNPGDELDLQCHFKSTSRTKTTNYGEGTAEEMCYAFIMYYPRENFKTTSLTSYLDIDPCEIEQTVIKGCDFAKLANYSDPETIGRYLKVTENCAVGYCKKECKAVVKEVRQHPCFQGSVKKIQIVGSENIQDVNTKYLSLKFWAGLESCNEELFREHIQNDPNWGRNETSDAATISHSTPLMTSALVVWIPIVMWLGLL